MKRYFRLIALALLFIAIPLLKVGCGATPPAPPLEIPSPAVLKFVQYEDIKIDLSTISSSQAQSSLNREVGTGAYSVLITVGPELAAATNDNIATLLATLQTLEIPVGEEVTTFEGTMTSIDLYGLETSYAAKLDFADFDLDGVNGTEGCSGHTAALPVCVRAWRDGERYLAWVFDAYPFPATADTPANPGKSRFRHTETKDITDPGITSSTSISFASRFDYRDPEDLRLETFWRSIGNYEEDFDAKEFSHMQITQIGPPSTSKKQLNLDRYIEGPVVGYADQQYLGQFQEGADFWSGSIFDSTGETPEVENLCVRISTADETVQSSCDALGISVAGIDFVEPAQDADTAFYDFPEEPTF